VTQNQALILRIASLEEELKTTRAQLAQAGKLATLGTMGASIAHELNNPLTVIGAEADEVLDLLSQQVLTDEQLHGSVHNIKRCAERMRVIVDHIRRYSREEKDLNWTQVDVNQVMEDALIILKKPLQTSGISVTTDFSDALPKIWGDATKLESVFQNIISNARDALESASETKRKGIVITTNAVGQERIEVRIKDNGPGIPENVRKELFRPFFTTKASGKGTGLGLSIARSIVNEHRGDIRVESHVGEGTEFELTFPVERRNCTVTL
jgi:C4-dicarboxylate-specific signal transduction histidine kinase